MTVIKPRLNAARYGRLLLEALPRPIETEEENERALAFVDKLMSKGEDRLTREERTLLKLLTRLIEDFEEKAYSIPEAPPWRVLQTLMKGRGIRQADLLHVFGSRGIASEVVNGKRAVSKVQAKALGEFFKVSPELFI